MSQVAKAAAIRADWFLKNLDAKIEDRSHRALMAIEEVKISAFLLGVTDFDAHNHAVPDLFKGFQELEREWLCGFNSAETLSSQMKSGEIPEECSLEAVLKALR
jgi:hypothetical protein